MNLAARVIRKLGRTLLVPLRVDPLTLRRIVQRPDTVELGSKYGSWAVPATLLAKDSVVYCVGCGEDITFDLALIETFGCEVYAFDPTPRAITHIKTAAANEPRYHFNPIGIWHRDELIRFYAPRDVHHVSHSIVNLQKTEEYFEAPVRRLAQVLADNGHAKLDLLKLDIEGAEYDVLASCLRDGIFPRVLCVEFDEYFHPRDRGFRNRIHSALEPWFTQGYSLVFTPGNGNYTLVRDR